MRAGLILYKGDKAYDISQLAESITWKGRKGSAARSVSISLMDDNSNGRKRTGINVTDGNQIIFSYDNKELFRGIIMTQQRSNSRKMPITAYDNGIYLANNKDTFTYENKTAQYIFIDICKRFGLKYSSAAKTSYKIPELTKVQTTAYDALLDALSQEYKATGIRHYIASSKGLLSLVKRRENMLEWSLDTSSNIISYSYKKSIEDIKTRVKIISHENKNVASKKNTALEKKIGIFQDIDRQDDDKSEAKIKEQAGTILKEKGTPEISLEVNAVGIPNVISGTGVYVSINELGISGTYYVDEDTHTFKGGSHTMKLKLNKTDDQEGT